MRKNPSSTTSLFKAQERRYYIRLANSSPAYREIKASFAISGFNITDDDAERIGRMIDALAPHLEEAGNSRLTSDI